MTDTVKDNISYTSLIVSQSMKIFNLEMSLAKHKSVSDLYSDSAEYKAEILNEIAGLLGYSGSHHHIPSILQCLIEQFIDCGYSKDTNTNGSWHKDDYDEVGIYIGPNFLEASTVCDDHLTSCDDDGFCNYCGRQ